MRILPVFATLFALAASFAHAPFAQADDANVVSSADYDGQTIKCEVSNFYDQSIRVLSISYSWTCEDPYTGFSTNHSDSIPCSEGLFCKIEGMGDHEFNGLYRASLCNVTQVTCEAQTVRLSQ